MHHLFTQASECLVLKFLWSCHHQKSVAPSAKRASNPLSIPMSIWGVVPILWLWFHLASGVQLIYFCSIGVQALNLIFPPPSLSLSLLRLTKNGYRDQQQFLRGIYVSNDSWTSMPLRPMTCWVEDCSVRCMSFSLSGQPLQLFLLPTPQVLKAKPTGSVIPHQLLRLGPVPPRE